MKGETRTSRSIDRSTDEIARRARDSIFAPRDSLRATRFDPPSFFFPPFVDYEERGFLLFFEIEFLGGKCKCNVFIEIKASKLVIFFEKSDRFNV